MAETIVRTSDLSGEGGPEAGVNLHTLELDGTRCVVDLTATEFDALSGVLAVYFEKGRPAPALAPVQDKPKRGRPKGSRNSAPAGEAKAKTNEKNLESDAIRVFCRANDVKVSDRGRISNAARKAWEDAGKPFPPADAA